MRRSKPRRARQRNSTRRYSVEPTHLSLFCQSSSTQRLMSVEALGTVLGLVLLFLGAYAWPSAGQRATTPAAFQPTDLAVTATVPACNVTGVPPDSPLHITFARAPVVGSGRVQVFDANNDRLIDSIDVSVLTRTRTIGGLPN